MNLQKFEFVALYEGSAEDVREACGVDREIPQRIGKKMYEAKAQNIVDALVELYNENELSPQELMYLLCIGGNSAIHTYFLKRLTGGENG